MEKFIIVDAGSLVPLFVPGINKTRFYDSKEDAVTFATSFYSSAEYYFIIPIYL
jgi:hypothetical protein